MTVTATDVDGDVPTYSIVGGVDQSDFAIDSVSGELTFTAAPDFEPAIDSVSGELTFTAAPDFEPAGDVNGDHVYEVTVQADDGNGGTVTQAIAVTVTNINEDPTITSANSASVAENETAVLTVAASDVDGDVPTYSIVGGADQSDFAISTTSGDLTFTTAPDFDIAGDSNGDNVYEVTVQAADGNGGMVTQAIAVTVTNVNEDPTITSASAASVAENQTSVLTVTASDVDRDVPTFSIVGGTDQSQFSINGTSGELTFTTAPDFDIAGDINADNVYEVTVQAADGNGGTVTQAIAVTVTNLNEDLTISSANTASVAENQTAALTVVGEDVDGDALTYTISGGSDSTQFSINGTSGDLTFTAAPDFDTPGDANGDNVYEVTVQVVDGNGSAATQTIAITVTNVNEDPAITSANSAAIPENQALALTVTSTDVDGDVPTFSIVGGADQSQFTIESVSGTLTFNVEPDFENPVDAGGTGTYHVVVQVADGKGGSIEQSILVSVIDVNEAPVVVNENPVNPGGEVDPQNPVTTEIYNVLENQSADIQVTATDEDANSHLVYTIVGGADKDAFMVDPVTGVVDFIATPDHEERSYYEVQVAVTDGDGLTAFKNLIVNVEDVNEVPTAVEDLLEASESQVLTIDPVASLLSNDSDPEQGVLEVVDFTQPLNGALSMNADGNLEYTPNDGFRGSDRFEYVIQDEGGLQMRATVFLDVRSLGVPQLAGANPAGNEFAEIDNSFSEQPDAGIVSHEVDSQEVVTPVKTAPTTIIAGSADASSAGAAINALSGEGLASKMRALSFNIAAVEAAAQVPFHHQASSATTTLLAQLLEHELSRLEIDFELAGYAQTVSLELQRAIDSLREEIDQIMDKSDQSSPLTALAPSVVGASLTAGIVTWILRSGLLLSATLTSSPLWRPLDPVPILVSAAKDEPWYADSEEGSRDRPASSDAEHNQKGVGHG